jgi:hypothetical protein
MGSTQNNGPTETSVHIPRKRNRARVFYTQLLNLESDEWHVAHTTTLEEENKLIEAGFEFIRYSEKDQVAMYRKRK